MIAFLAFCTLAAAVWYLHFALAHRAWRRLAAHTANEIDLQYLRIEDYFGRSFRAKLGEWLRLPEAPDSTPQLRAIDKGSERILALGSSACPPQRLSEHILVVQGDFRAGSGCYFTREIYVAGNCEIGSDARLQAIAVDGSLRLGSGVVVRRWVDASGAVHVGRDSRIDSRLTSRTSITLAPGARVLSAYAPEVSTEGRTEDPIIGFSRPAVALEIPPQIQPRKLPSVEGFHPRLLRQISADTWVYRGDLRLSIPLHLRAKLIVHGDCVLARGSYLEDDLKAIGSMVVGAGSRCQGAVASDQDVVLEEGVLFEYLIYANRQIILRQGVRGYGERPVAASAGQYLWAEPNVVVRGKLAAGLHVIAVPQGLRLEDLGTGTGAG